MPVERRAYERSTDPATTARADRPRCNGVGLSIADRQEPRASLSWKSGGLPPYSDADRGRRAARRPERGTVVNVVVWVVQVLLAVAFLGAGAMKVSQPRQRLATNMGWVEDYSDTGVKTVGALEVLAALGLILPAVTVLGLLGPNGSGKTTTVRILTTLLRPDAGRAIVAGYDLSRRPMAARAQIGLTGQYAAVDEPLTGRENLELIGSLLELPRPLRRDRAAELLELVGLDDAADRLVRTYSGGMRRRLDLAASLVGRPRVLFLDEPTTGLDPRSR